MPPFRQLLDQGAHPPAERLGTIIIGGPGCAGAMGEGKGESILWRLTW